MKTIFRAALCFILACSPAAVKGQLSKVYDVVLSGGRVIDPETKLDGIRNIGIVGNRIAAISVEPLRGKEIIDVTGLVVAPGFIDLHVHGRSNKEQEYQLHDGITTALELEWGIEHLKEWYASRTSKALINYGASVCWPFERFRSMDKYKNGVEHLRQVTLKGESKLETLFNVIGPSYADTPTSEENSITLSNIRKSLEDGGIGIGVPIGYLPKTNPEETFRVYQLAGELNALIFSHVREPGLISIHEAIANAAVTGAPLHLVHINSMSLGKIRVALELIQAANKKGIDVSTELYPYTAASTLIQSAVFNEGWQEKLGMTYGDLQWVATGERLTKETFDKYRVSGGAAIMHMMKPEWINTGVSAPGVMIASDGMPFSALAHPRTAGTFCRVLGKYVREDKVIDLPTAIEKMTLLPAKRLEGISPPMHRKGRIQVGADADITIFNASTVIDKATFEKGLEFSQGIEFVMVNGVFVLRKGKTVNEVFPGQPVFGKFKK
ncbi:MAG: amidohydrolase family protein [Bacteroidetes bacterium]|nr:amidohydrolase family protein [Bacteroidota bacterium]